MSNVVATRGDARSMPYPADTFDAAYTVLVLGEIPDRDAGLRELRRVLRPGGAPRDRRGRHEPAHGLYRRPSQEGRGGAGLRFERRLGGRLAYVARFVA